jgi:translocation and assembly module TamB
VEQPGLTAEPLRSAAAEIRGEGTRVRLRGTARALEREALRVEGELRLPGAAGHPDDAAPDVAAAAATLAARQADLDVSLRAEEFDVAWLPLPAAVSDVRGRVDLDVRVTGSVAAPWVEGSFGVREGAFSVASTLQRFEGIHLAGTVDSERLVLDSLAVESGGGTFRGAGRAEYADPEDVRIALQFTADDLPIVGEGMTLGRLTCETDARGTMIPGILAGEDRRVDLDITLRDCAVVLPRGRSNEVMEMGDHPDFYRIGGATAGSGDRGADGSETLAVTLVARVDVPGELWIRRQDMQFAATGGITLVAGAAAERGARVEGPVSVRRGWVDMFGRRFDVQSGEVVFAGTYPIDGNIDMRLVTRTAEATVYVDVGGTLREPEVEMSSDPPRDTSEILALLYLGRTSDLTSEEEIAIGDRAGAVAQTVVEAVGLAVFQSAMTQGMGPLTVLRVDPGAGGFSDARVRAGVSLTDGLYVEYAYQFAADDLQNAHEGRIEWMILRNFSVEGYFGDAQSGGVRLQYRAEW